MSKDFNSPAFLKPFDSFFNRINDSDYSTTDVEDNRDIEVQPAQKDVNESISALRRYIDQAFAVSNRNLEAMINRSMSQASTPNSKIPGNMHKRFDAIGKFWFL